MHPAECKNCNAPLNMECKCEDCIGDFALFQSNGVPLREFCHICREMNRVMFRSAYFQTLIGKENDLRKRMGL